MNIQTPRQYLMSRINTICAEHGVKWTEVLAPCRRPAVVRPRFIICRMLREEFGWSLPRIGAYMMRDHTTIYNAVRRARERGWQ